MINIRKLRWKNFLSYGNYDTIFDFDNYNFTVITGKNGEGKCLDKSTEIDVIMDEKIKKEFLELVRQ